MKTKSLLILGFPLGAILVGAGLFIWGAADAPISFSIHTDPVSPNPPILSQNERTVESSTVARIVDAMPDDVSLEHLPAYVKSLRSAGATDQQVWTVVRSRVGAHFEKRRATLRAITAPTAEARRDKQRLIAESLQVEERVTADIAGSEPSRLFTPRSMPATALQGAGDAAATMVTLHPPKKPSPQISTTSVDATAPATLPAILVTPDASQPMSELQIAEWNKLEQTFIAQLGDKTLSPADPEYRARWQSAQESSDALFRQKFGVEAFLRYNTAAGRMGTGE